MYGTFIFLEWYDSERNITPVNVCKFSSQE